eukprot:TRINITY_DN5985_c0_g1_i1.p1 TRINITY_DN5985_c0_g1~~TRINITY_DN5985_c0_g1_i1.p1  ORF type:complete len:334 (-),score=77.17 TRINITY_DN5985_c0_g1_i1:914-1915(-)
MAGGKKKGSKPAPRAVETREDLASEEIDENDLLDAIERAFESEKQESSVDEGRGSTVGTEAKAQMLQRHTREVRDLKTATQKKLQAVKKGDKAERSQVELDAKKLEDEMVERHSQELAALESQVGSMSSQQDTLDEGKKDHPLEQEKSTQSGSASESSAAADQKKSKGPGRQQLRKNRKLEEEKKRKEELQAKFAGGINHRAIEKEKLEKILAPLGLRIHEIPPDGNCLYRAVAHQMDRIGLSNSAKKEDFASIRLVAANHLRSNVDDFLPFMTTEDGDMHTTESYQKYCNQVANSNDWGGELELRALSIALRVPITVFMASEFFFFFFPLFS